MITGGLLRKKRDVLNQYVHGCYGYMEPSLVQSGWSEKHDVFAYGVVLLGLIMKSAFTNDTLFVYELANSECKSGYKYSLVHQSLEIGLSFSPGDGIKITELAHSYVSIITLKSAQQWSNSLNVCWNCAFVAMKLTVWTSTGLCRVKVWHFRRISIQVCQHEDR